MDYYNKKRRIDDDEDEKKYPVNPDARRALIDLDKRSKEWWPNGDGSYSTNNSTITEDGREIVDM